MKKALFNTLCLAGFLAAGPASADYFSYNIADNYIGSNAHGYGDVIGASFFDIDHLNVRYSGKEIYVSVFTNYKSGESAALGTTYGDLFISNNGWNPHGSAANGYKNDDASNGEHWEFVFDTSEGKLYGGNFSVLLSDDVNHSGTFRNGQEVLRDHGGTLADVGSVTFGSETVSGHLFNTITYGFDGTALGVHANDNLGFRWEETCANDAIEGAGTVRVPLPATPFLVLIGLAGLGISRRKIKL